MKKLLALFVFVVVVIFSCFMVSADNDTAKLYNYYSDNMLFKQNDDAILGGKAPAGSVITCTLYNSQSQSVAYAETVTGSDGVFNLSFLAPAGSFEEYRLVLTVNGDVFAELKDVVFGELWLAGGQSNMQLSLWASKTGMQMMAENKRGSDALRFLDIPHPANYKGSPLLVPAEPLDDFENSTQWYKGSDERVYELSGVAYYFAESLIAELGMPVGLLDANLGGSAIYSWLSRESIESNPELLADLIGYGRYIPLESWNEAGIDHYAGMTVNFNKTISPLRNMRLSGMLWYQGESDINHAYGKYARAFTTMQDTYTELFGYKDGKLPIVFTQLASYAYGDMDWLQKLNAEFADMQQERPDSRALTSILDVPLDYDPGVHAIHPACKKEVGEKMAYAAKGLVYGMYDSYTTATVEKTEIKDGSIYVTFRDVGDKLIADGNSLRGFSICSSDGIYFSAKAEIVSYNTVRIYSDSVKNPCSATYAYSQTNNHANLYASRNGEKLLAVSPFITDRNYSTHLWHHDAWANCDFAEYWHCHTNEYSGFYNTWKADGAEISFGTSTIGSGNALYITSGSKEFSVMPNFTYKENLKEVHFMDFDRNWSDYGTLTFKVKVNSGNALKFDGLKIKVNDSLWVMPAVKDMHSTGTAIESDGNVYTITLDLNRLYPLGNIYAETLTADVLTGVMSAEFKFSSANSTVKIALDDINFGPDIPADSGISGSENKPNLLERIKALFVTMYMKIVMFFKNLFKR